MFYAFLPLPGGAVGVVFALLALAACVYCPPIGLGVLIGLCAWAFPEQIALSILWVVETVLVFAMCCYLYPHDYSENFSVKDCVILYLILLPLSGVVITYAMDWLFFSEENMQYLTEQHLESQSAIHFLTIAFPLTIYAMFFLYLLKVAIRAFFNPEVEVEQKDPLHKSLTPIEPRENEPIDGHVSD